ncbi:MAG: coproporphyrinogen dehydrogenase HemZ [Clostridia bacterium]|nr:coproporphyrinogen dehydrogenase HemZ [Clostridia bacterium]
MFSTNSEWLENEMMDVVRLFGAEGEDIVHYFSYSEGTFYNCVSVRGEFYDFEEKEKDIDGDEEFRRFAKRYAKLAVYKVLSGLLDVSYPWGALTGIRPTKMAYAEKAAGRDFKPLFSKLMVSDANAKMVGEVLDSQSGLYERNFHNGADIFVSVPFCPTKCEYCSFVTAPLKNTAQYVEPYVDSLLKEIGDLSSYVGKINSVYVGGGTPFTLSEGDLNRVLFACEKLSHGAEFTVEAGRPDTFTREKLKICKDHGVTRMCVNPQSFSDKTLEAIGRKHTANDTLDAYAMARDVGFDINLDLIAGLFGETLEEFSESVEKAANLAPENITVHSLCLKSGAKLKENVKRLDIPEIDAMISFSRERLESSGYRPYYLYRQKYQAGGNENVGWCLEGKACVYNVDVMEEICDNVAVGANAISKRVFEDGRIERLPTPKDVKTYLEKAPSIIEKRRNFFLTDDAC